MSPIVAAALVLVMLGGLLLVPLGLPGVWLMVLVLLGAALAGEVTWGVWAALAGVALVAEVVEFVTVDRMARRFGGSSRAFWGALVGGLVGAVAGSPVPVVGNLVAGVVGTFVGAAGVTWWETRSAARASRVGWGTLLARVLAVGFKTAAGVVVLVVGGAALFVG